MDFPRGFEGFEVNKVLEWERMGEFLGRGFKYLWDRKIFLSFQWKAHDPKGLENFLFFSELSLSG